MDDSHKHKIEPKESDPRSALVLIHFVPIYAVRDHASNLIGKAVMTGEGYQGYF